jgi:hypothetical protein
MYGYENGVLSPLETNHDSHYIVASDYRYNRVSSCFDLFLPYISIKHTCRALKQTQKSPINFLVGLLTFNTIHAIF